MPNHLRFRSALLVLTLAVLAGCSEGTPADPSPSFAAANPPIHQTELEDIDALVSCGTFDLAIVGTFERRFTTFFDSEGNPRRATAVVKYRTTATNVTTGESTEDNADFAISVDLVTGLFVNNGKLVNIKDGLRFRDIGRFVLDQATDEIIFEAGPKDSELGDSVPLLCQALA
jgi:hypothetical protein